MGREGYSRGEFEATQAEADKAAKRSQTALEHASGYTVEGNKRKDVSQEAKGEFSKVYRSEHKRSWQAKEKLEKLKTAGHAEANELDREYNRLLSEAEQAESAVRNFEMEKLGMSPEEEPNEEAA